MWSKGPSRHTSELNHYKKFHAVLAVKAAADHSSQ